MNTRALPRTLLIIGIALASMLTWADATVRCNDCGWFHETYRTGHMDAPFAYRILVPFLVELSGLPVLVGYGLIVFVSCAVLFITLDKIGGPLAIVPIAVLLPIMYQREFFYSGTVSIVEAACWAGVLLWLRSYQRYRLPIIFGIVAIATLNRETGIMLAYVYFAVTKDVRGAIEMGMLSLLIVLGLRIAIEPARDFYTPALVWQANTTTDMASQAIIPHAVMLMFWLPALLKIKQWPSDLRAVAIYCLPAYLFAVAAFGVWGEVRLLLPAFVVLSPGIAMILKRQFYQ